MTNAVKILLGVGAVATVAATTYVITKKIESKKVNNEKPEVEDVEEVEENEETDSNNSENSSFADRVKIAVYRKSIKLLTWFMINKEKIDAVGSMLGLASAFLSVINAIKEYNMGKKLNDRLDAIYSSVLNTETIIIETLD